MKAVNLIPTDARGSGSSVAAQASTYVVLGVLAVALAFVTVYVLASNSIADRTAKLSSLQTQLAQTQAQASNLVNYTQFAQLVQQRAQTVKTIASGRFDWHTPLIDLSQVVPANTSLQSLQAGLGSGSAASGTSASGSAGGALLGSASGPAIELSGCTGSQDDVARLMSRLRLIAGATRVTLGNSQKSTTAGGSTASGAQGAVGCGANAPTFDLLVALTPLSGSSAAAATAATGSAAGASATPSSTTTTTTPAGTASSSTATGASGTNTPAAATTSTTSATGASAPTTTTGGSS